MEAEGNIEQVSYCGPKNLGPTLENLVAPWREGLLHRCCTYKLSPVNMPYAFLFMAITDICYVGKHYHKNFYLTLGDVLLPSGDVLPHKYY